MTGLQGDEMPDGKSSISIRNIYSEQGARTNWPCCYSMNLLII